MNHLSHSLLFLALASALSHGARAADAPSHADATRLSQVEVEASVPDEADAESSGPWGKASLKSTPAQVNVIGRDQIEDRHIRTLSELARERTLMLFRACGG